MLRKDGLIVYWVWGGLLRYLIKRLKSSLMDN